MTVYNICVLATAAILLLTAAGADAASRDDLWRRNNRNMEQRLNDGSQQNRWQQPDRRNNVDRQYSPNGVIQQDIPQQTCTFTTIRRYDQRGNLHRRRIRVCQ